MEDHTTFRICRLVVVTLHPIPSCKMVLCPAQELILAFSETGYVNFFFFKFHDIKAKTSVS